MPSITDNKALGSQFLDKRTKLLDCQKQRVKAMYEQNGISIRGLARIFHVDRRTIDFILYPEKHEQNLKTRAANGGSTKYYVRNTHTAAMKRHRQHKKEALGSL